ncbi:hypothetical protein EFM06_06960 [Lactobacillus helveticus]|uniref:hypothetical protein n=1 Tax=Lactobacillus helveticus TaxID=1587 RepID=UPI0021820A46|nr:hypothetical protein [Lactobacillus helveticus]MCT0165259.1 hypothetical protein [Lactobacillus helveticus]MCT0192605.1 hypothetical protein [Lactobacillus helveticus]MCT0197452.1 hypothetical protein [Lactobacillus helveticus]
MREIPVKQVKSLMKQLLKSKESKYVVLLTKKKDRSLTIESDGEQIKLTEQGYENSVNTFAIADNVVKHAFTAEFKCEFPRSHQVYVSKK